MRFAAASAMGENRADALLDGLRRNPLLAAGPVNRPIRRMLVGILAGDDLRLSEIGTLVDGIRAAFGPDAALDLGTVNDEETFSGRLTAVLLLFEEGVTSAQPAVPGATARRRNLSAAEHALVGSDRFGSSDKTYWKDENLDIPTYLRRNLTLER